MEFALIDVLSGLPGHSPWDPKGQTRLSAVFLCFFSVEGGIPENSIWKSKSTFQQNFTFAFHNLPYSEC